MTSENNTQITLRLEGSRAAYGVSLTHFENFIDSFLAALRDYDRGRRGEPIRKYGHPDRRAEAVTAFRLVRFAPGSKYPEGPESTVKRLVDRVVWAEGAGHLTSLLRGALTIDRIEAVEQGEQSMLFTNEPMPDAELLARQGISAPQGLASLSDSEWDDVGAG
jgi:hypothetical protein